MSSTIDFFAKTYQSEITRFVEVVDAADKTGAMSIEQVKDMDALLRGLPEKRKMLKSETRLMTSADKAAWMQRLDEYDAPMRERRPTFDRLKQNAQKGSLLGPGGRPHRGREDEDFYGGKTNDEALQNASEIQDKTDAAGQRILGTLADARAVAEETDAELRRQGEQLEDIRGEVKRIDGLLDFAQRLVSTVSKRIYTDRILMCFTLINVILIISAVAYLATQENGLSSNDPEPEPDEPSG